MIKCEEAQHICDKSQYAEASFLEKILITVHLLFCKICRGYSCNNGKLTKAVKASHIRTLRPEEKQRLKNRINVELGTK